MLKAGGRLVVLATSATSGEAGRRARLKKLVAAAKKAKVPSSRIEVYITDTLARWLEQHPGIAASFMGLPPGCQQLGRWIAHPHHRTPWQASNAARDAITRYRRDLGVAGTTSTPHLHISGPPGAGKTRLALEICRDADWRFDVLYVESKGSTNVDQLLERLEQSMPARAVVVVDEVDPQEARRWNGLVLRAPDRLRLVTIGPRRAPAGYEILEHEVEPLEESDILTLLRTSHPGLPTDRLEYAARFSDGFPKLARVTADALERDRNLDVRALLERREVGDLLNSLIGDASRRKSLLVLASLESVGWENDAAAEGKAIAAHFGLDWGQVRSDIEAIQTEQGIAPAAGDLRYISPRPLGVLLAVEAWQADAERMRGLYDKLPTEPARRAYEERLRLISESKQVEAFAATELRRFRTIEELSSESAVRRWVGFGHALPTVATRYVREALEQATIEVRRTIADGARRHLVWSLVEYAARADCFRDALWALAHLAVAENETYANNATAEFVGKFQLVLGGTAAPYLERLTVLDEILASPDASYRALAVSALAKPLSTAGEFRTRNRSEELAPVPPEWRPTTQHEVNEAIIGALDRLADLAKRDSAPEVRKALADAVSRIVMRLRHATERERVAEIIIALTQNDEAVRERLWHAVHDVLSRTERYWKDLSEQDLVWVRALLHQLEDPSLIGRVRRALAGAEWNAPASSYADLANEVRSQPQAWPTIWTWLLSGETKGGVWAFGEALAYADDDGRLLTAIEMTTPGPDRRALAAYLTVRASRAPAGWLDDWLDRFGTLHADPNLLVELTSRTGASPRAVDRILDLVRAGASPAMTEQLSYGRWADPLPPVDMERLIRGLAAAPPHRGSALVLVEGRFERDPSFISRIEDLLLELVADPLLVRESPNHGYYWQKLALALVPHHAARIAAAILAAHDPRTRDDGWFLEHSTYTMLVLDQCIELDRVAVWTALRPYLEDPSVSLVYTIGLSSLLDQMPRAAVLDWIAMDPKFRGALTARIIAKNIHDGSLLLDVLERYGDLRDVAQAVQSEYFSGGWSGPVSAHWEELANGLRPLAARADKSRAARWAQETIAQLETAAERERNEEAETRLRGR